MSDLDCPTTDPVTYASCKCGHTSKGTKYCDILGGDDEWTESYALVNDKFNQNFSLKHTTRGLLTVTLLKGLAPVTTTKTTLLGSAQMHTLSCMWI